MRPITPPILLLLLTSPATCFVTTSTSLPAIVQNPLSTSSLSASPSGSEQGERRPWDFFRFVSQSSKFVPSPPFIPAKKAARRSVQPGDVLWSPDSPSQNDFTFAPLDDVVMGGASASNFDNVSGIWRGRVTDANNGGFVGVRNTPYFDWDMSNCRGLELTVRSKSKPSRLKVGVRDSVDFNGIVWASSVDVKTTPTKVRVPLDKLKPTMFAKVVDQGTLKKNSLVGFQLVYSKFEYDGGLNPKFEIGDIDVQVLEIKAY